MSQQNLTELIIVEEDFDWAAFYWQAVNMNFNVSNIHILQASKDQIEKYFSNPDFILDIQFDYRVKFHCFCFTQELIFYRLLMVLYLTIAGYWMYRSYFKFT